MKRTIIKELLLWKNSAERMPLILEGARQVGKTYLLKSFGENYFEDFHYFNFEENEKFHEIFNRDFNTKRIIDELSILTGKIINKNKDLIIFDEIQACPKAITSLKYFSENSPEIYLATAGSLLGIALNKGSFPVGKIDYLHLYPLSFPEFLQEIDQSLYNYINHYDFDKEEISPPIHQKTWDYLKHYLITGGLPAVINCYIKEINNNALECFTKIRKIQKTLIKDYLNDISKHSGKINALHIENIWRSIPSQLMKSIDGGAKKYIFKNVISGYTGYRDLASPINWLEKAGLIHKIHICNKSSLPLSAYSKENSFKLLFFDIGILAALADLDFESIYRYDFGTYKGFFAENFVATELISSGIEKIYSWSEGKAEIEFLLTIKGKIIPIEVKSGNIRQAKSLKSYTEKYNPEKKYILSGQLRMSDNILKYRPLYRSYSIRDELLDLKIS